MTFFFLACPMFIMMWSSLKQYFFLSKVPPYKVLQHCFMGLQVFELLYFWTIVEKLSNWNQKTVSVMYAFSDFTSLPWTVRVYVLLFICQHMSFYGAGRQRINSWCNFSFCSFDFFSFLLSISTQLIFKYLKNVSETVMQDRNVMAVVAIWRLK